MFSLRRRTKSDAEKIVTWIPDARALYNFAGPRMKWPVDARQIAASDRTDGILAWVLVENDEPVGHFHIVLPQAGVDTPRLGRVILKPDYRGKGLSSELLTRALEQASRLQCTELELLVEHDNLPAIAAYEAAGFTRVPTEQAEVITMHISLEDI